MRAQKRDANEPAVIEGLELMGYVVERHYAPDPYDIAVRRQSSPLRLPMEIKGPNGRLTENQEGELARNGIVVVRTVQEACDAAERWL